jgi:glutathione S-transferase
MTADEALQAVRAAQSDAPWTPNWPQVDDERIGQTMVLSADDYGRDPIDGVVSALSDRHVTLTREAGGLGRVRVHFPKVGYELTAAA